IPHELGITENIAAQTKDFAIENLGVKNLVALLKSANSCHKALITSSRPGHFARQNTGFSARSYKPASLIALINLAISKLGAQPSTTTARASNATAIWLKIRVGPISVIVGASMT